MIDVGRLDWTSFGERGRQQRRQQRTREEFSQERSCIGTMQIFRRRVGTARVTPCIARKIFGMNSVSNAVSNADESLRFWTSFDEHKVVELQQIWTTKRLGEQGIWT